MGGAGGSAGAGGGAQEPPQWRDWAQHQCRDCPGPEVLPCERYLSTVSHEPSTQRFTVQGQPSLIEVVHAELMIYWEARDSGGAPASGESVGVATIHQDTLQFDFSSELSGYTDIVLSSMANLVLADACGFMPEYSLEVVATGPGEPVQILCRD